MNSRNTKQMIEILIRQTAIGLFIVNLSAIMFGALAIILDVIINTKQTVVITAFLASVAMLARIYYVLHKEYQFLSIKNNYIEDFGTLSIIFDAFINFLSIISLTLKILIFYPVKFFLLSLIFIVVAISIGLTILLPIGFTLLSILPIWAKTVIIIAIVVIVALVINYFTRLGGDGPSIPPIPPSSEPPSETFIELDEHKVKEKEVV